MSNEDVLRAAYAAFNARAIHRYRLARGRVLRMDVADTSAWRGRGLQPHQLAEDLLHKFRAWHGRARGGV